MSGLKMENVYRNLIPVINRGISRGLTNPQPKINLARIII
jgi:hypothetical protein